MGINDITLVLRSTSLLGEGQYEWLSKYYWERLMKFRSLQRDECLNRSKRIPQGNHQHPNMALGGITPKQRQAMVS